MKRKLYRLILSDEFVAILKNINSNISKRLLFLNNNKDFGFSISYIDVTNKEDYISYISSTKISNDKDNWYHSRDNQKIGRFITKILEESPQSIEKFVNDFKAEIKSMNNFDNFDIISGKRLSKYYHESSYVDGGGSLNKSCMRHDRCQDYFYFYNVNSDKVKMVLLYENNRKKRILGRALLWNIDEPNIKILDRIYTTTDSDQVLFIKYAIKNGWYYKKSQRFNETMFMDSDKKRVNIDCKIFIKKDDYQYFPYLDTFYYYNKKDFYITNKKDDYKNNKNVVKLRSTDGREQGNEHFVFDVYNNDMVKIEDTVFCIDDARILLNDAIKIDKDYVTPNGIRFSEYDGRMYLKNDVIWSFFHRTFMKKDNVFKVYLDKNKKIHDYIHLDFKGEYFEYVISKDSYFIKKLLLKGIDNNFYIKEEYNEEEILSKKETIEDKTTEELNKLFDEFILELSKKKKFSDYGSFKNSVWL